MATLTTTDDQLPRAQELIQMLQSEIGELGALIGAGAASDVLDLSTDAESGLNFLMGWL
jgi:hypothetical protein